MYEPTAHTYKEKKGLLIHRDLLNYLIDEDEFFITENEYRDKIYLQSNDCVYEIKDIHKRITARHEIINGELKVFVHSSPFRQNHNLQSYCFHSVVHGAGGSTVSKQP